MKNTSVFTDPGISKPRDSIGRLEGTDKLMEVKETEITRISKF